MTKRHLAHLRNARQRVARHIPDQIQIDEVSAAVSHSVFRGECHGTQRFRLYLEHLQEVLRSRVWIQRHIALSHYAFVRHGDCPTHRRDQIKPFQRLTQYQVRFCREIPLDERIHAAAEGDDLREVNMRNAGIISCLIIIW